MVLTERRVLKSGTKSANVLHAFQEGIALRDIPKITGLSNKQVRTALCHLREDGYLPPSTPEGKKHNIKIALLGKPKSEEQIKKASFVWEKIAPLAVRELFPWEITEITKSVFDGKQVRNALYRRGKKVLADKYPDSQKVKERQLEGIKRLQQRLLIRKASGGDKEGPDIVLARALWEKGLITVDISTWQELEELYKSHNKPLPENNFDILILEAFLKAIKEYVYKDRRGPLILLVKLSNDIETNWLKNYLPNERNFIVTQIKNEFMHSLGLTLNESEKRERIREMVEREKQPTRYDLLITKRLNRQ